MSGTANPLTSVKSPQGGIQPVQPQPIQPLNGLTSAVNSVAGTAAAPQLGTAASPNAFGAYGAMQEQNSKPNGLGVVQQPSEAQAEYGSLMSHYFPNGVAQIYPWLEQTYVNPPWKQEGQSSE